MLGVLDVLMGFAIAFRDHGCGTSSLGLYSRVEDLLVCGLGAKTGRSLKGTPKAKPPKEP